MCSNIIVDPPTMFTALESMSYYKRYNITSHSSYTAMEVNDCMAKYLNS